MNQTKQDPATQYADATREELLNELLAAQNQTRQTELRAIKVYQENEKIKADPELARKRAQLEHDLETIDLFVQSGAFVNKKAKKPLTKYECYAIIMCGREMGMKEIESLQTFYIVNGQIKPYGDKMVSLITRAGYIIDYLEESKQSVKVRIYHPDPEINYDRTELVLASNPLVSGGQAYKFAPQNKMRFHGVRMHASFGLAHLFGSVADEFTSQFIDWQGNNQVEEATPVKGIDLTGTQKQKQDQTQVLTQILHECNTAEELYKHKDAAYAAGLDDLYEQLMDDFDQNPPAVEDAKIEEE